MLKMIIEPCDTTLWVNSAFSLNKQTDRVLINKTQYNEKYEVMLSLLTNKIKGKGVVTS